MKNEIMKTFYKIKHGYISKCFNTLFNKKKRFYQNVSFLQFCQTIMIPVEVISKFFMIKNLTFF